MKKTGLLTVLFILVLAVNVFASTTLTPSTTSTLTPSASTSSITPSSTSTTLRPITSTTPSSTVTPSTTTITSSTVTPKVETKKETNDKSLPKAGASTGIFYATAILAVVSIVMYRNIKK